MTSRRSSGSMSVAGGASGGGASAVGSARRAAIGERGRADEVGEHHCDLAALDGGLGGDGVEQLTAVPDNTYAKILQVLRRQTRQDGVVDGVLAECRLVLFEAKAP